MSDLVLVSASRMRHIEPFSLRSLGLPRVDDRREVRESFI